jgi:hypothetical protein
MVYTVKSLTNITQYFVHVDHDVDVHCAQIFLLAFDCNKKKSDKSKHRLKESSQKMLRTIRSFNI